MAIPTLTAEHRRFQLLVGHWQGTETMYPSQWDPEGGEAIGRNYSRLALNGFALITDYEQERDGVLTFRGHGVMTYDPQAARYEMYWFDSMGSRPEHFTGNFEGDVLTLSHAGPGMHARLTYDLSEPGLLGSRMEMSPDGQEWRTFFECTYAPR